MPEHTAYPPPPPEVVSFLQRVFDFAETLEPAEGMALRRLVRAGLMADDGTIEAVLNSDVSGFVAPGLSRSGLSQPAWYWS